MTDDRHRPMFIQAAARLTALRSEATKHTDAAWAAYLVASMAEKHLRDAEFAYYRADEALRFRR